MSNMSRRAIAVIVIAALASLPHSLPWAATPSSGTVAPSSGPIVYTGGPFDFNNPTGTPDTPAGPGTPPVCQDPSLPCDDFALTVSIPPSDPNIYFLRVNLNFANPASDFDLYLLDGSGNDVDHSLGSTGEQETVGVQAPSGTSQFTVRVTPFDVVTGAGGDTYTATVTLLQQQVPPEPPLQPTVPGVPRYENYSSPSDLGNGAGEPTLGVNFDTDKIMYIAGLETLRVGFDDCASPAQVTWEDVSFPTTSTASLDPILFTDSGTNRTFASQLTGACSSTAFTDDDGENWTPSEGCGTPAGADHQTIGGGPFPPDDPIGPTTSYPNAVYYCSQEIATAFCALSRDGGLTFGPGVPAWNLTECGGVHGHIKVAADGTVYVPNRDCGAPATAAVVVSEDSGQTWSIRQVPFSTPPFNGVIVDPSVGIGADGRIYFGYQRSDGHAWVAVSDDKGLSWRDNQDVGMQVGVQNSVFAAVVAGHNNRAAYAFLGAQQGGDYENPATYNGSWHLYVAHTFDGGDTWTVVDATPLDPVQRGSICNEGTGCANVPDDRNLLDFMDVQMDRVGRVVVSYADGCITQSCIQGGINDFTAKAKIARQSGGKRLLPQHDPHPQEPNPPKAPFLNGSRIAPGVVRLTWSKPDNGGADITEYNIYRGLTSGGEVFLNSTTAKGSYSDITADPATGYYYQVAAVNSAGEGTFCNEVSVPSGVVPGVDPCFAPGVTVAVDTLDDPPNTPPTPAVDIQSVSVAEPYGTDGSGRLVFTLQVGSAASAPPTSQWYVLWNRTTPDASFDRNYVAMKTSAAGVPSFEYGKISPPSVNLPTRFGDADEGSYDPATGTIRIVVSTSNVDGVVAGQTLSIMQARTFFSRADGLPVTSSASSDFSPEGAYTLVGNESCRSNEAPRAELTRTPASGCVPLTVDFDASASTDPDTGDTIASYQFDFGDGTPAVNQASPTISHTYTSNGVWAARLHVTDSRGKISQNVDLEEIVVHPVPVAQASGSATICFGGSTPLSGSGGTSCSWSPAAGLSDPESCTPVASPSQTTTYTLTVTDGNGCGSTNAATVTVTVEPCAVDEVSPLIWDAGSKDTLSWPVTVNAAVYRVYRGEPADLPALLDGSPDACLRFEGAATTTGPVLTETPAEASFYWYLVVGVSGPNEGPAGNATAGPRIVNSTGACP